MNAPTLTFLAGTHAGQVFTLPHNRELRLGRDLRADISIPEDLVSRQHAKIFAGVVTTLHDLGSRNGTFVNGRRVSSAELANGDRIAVGTTVVEVGLPQPVAPQRDRTWSTASMAGSLSEIALPDVLQMLQVSRKTGILALASEDLQGEIEVSDGDIVDAQLFNFPAATGLKAMCRILTWQTGVFELRATKPDGAPRASLCGSTQGLLMEVMRQQDELERIRAELNDADRALCLGPNRSPLSDPLRHSIVALVRAQSPTVQGCMDALGSTDLEVALAIAELLGRGSLALR